MRIIVISCLVFVHPLFMTFWKVQPNLPKYLEFAQFLYVHMSFLVIAVRFIISFGFEIIEFKFVSYRCASLGFFPEVGGKSCFIERVKM